MADLGVAFFDPAFSLSATDQVWLDGGFLSIAGGRQTDWAEDVSHRVIIMHSGNGVVASGRRGDKAPDAYDRRSPVITLYANNESDYYKIRKLKADGTGFWFSDGVRVSDTFTATSAATYTLSRRRAKGVVTAVDETSHPTKVYFNGSLDGTKATIGANEQTVTANGTGEIEIRYTPVFWCIVSDIPESQQFHNRREITLALQEVPLGDFT